MQHLSFLGILLKNRYLGLHFAWPFALPFGNVIILHFFNTTLCFIIVLCTSGIKDCVYQRGRRRVDKQNLQCHECIKRFTIRLSIFLTLARACDKRFSADHDTMLSLLIKAFGPWAFTFYQTVFLSYFQKGSGQNIKSLFFFRLLTLRISEYV